MMQNTVAYFGWGAISLVTAMAGLGTGGVVSSLTAPEQEYRLEIEHLKFVDGEFVQKLRPIGVSTIHGKWSAQIVRGTRPICSGGGESPYDGTEKTMSPSDWTGGDCPELEPGDVATAVWSYVTSKNYRVTIDKSITIGNPNT